MLFQKGICGAFDPKSVFDIDSPDQNEDNYGAKWTDEERKELLKLHDEYLNNNGPIGIQYTYTVTSGHEKGKELVSSET